MGIKITAETLEEFQIVQSQLKLIEKNGFLNNFSNAEIYLDDYLQIKQDENKSIDNIVFPSNIKIGHIEFKVKEKEENIIYNFKIWASVFSNEEKEVNMIFYLYSEKPNVNISISKI